MNVIGDMRPCRGAVLVEVLALAALAGCPSSSAPRDGAGVTRDVSADRSVADSSGDDLKGKSDHGPVPDRPRPDMPTPDMPEPDIPPPDMMQPDLPPPDMMQPDMMVHDLPLPDMFKPPAWSWIAGSGSADYIRDVTLDSAGNAYIQGTLQSSFIMGSVTVNKQGMADLYVAKISPLGTPLWAVNFPSSWSIWGHGIALGPTGSIYVTGKFFKTATFGSTKLTATTGGSADGDLFVAKLSPSGVPLWAVKAGGHKYDISRGIAVDQAGNAYITGTFAGSGSFGSHKVSSNSDDHDLFVAKLSSLGTWQWVQTAGAKPADEGRGVSLDAAGNVYVTGVISGQVTLGGVTLKPPCAPAMLVAKLAPDGKVLWAKTNSGAASQSTAPTGLTVSGSTLTLLAQGSGAVGLDSTTVTPPGTSKYLYLARLDTGGKVLWAKAYGGTASTDQITPWYITLGLGGATHLLAEFKGTVTVGAQKITSTSGSKTELLLLKLNNAGANLWHRAIQGTLMVDNTVRYGMAVDTVDCIRLGGTFAYTTATTKTITLHGKTHTSNGSADIFMWNHCP